MQRRKSNKSAKKRQLFARSSSADEGRLLMDAIYESKDPVVRRYYSQVVEEENAVLAATIERGEAWSMSAYLDRVHMRMGMRFLHLLSPVMQQRFHAEYPLAALGGGLSPATLDMSMASVA